MAHETGEPKNLLILGIGLTSVVVLVGVMFGLQSYFYEIRDAEQQVKVLGKQNAELLELRAKEQKRLTTAAYLDKGAGKVRIPINVAMEKLVEKGRNGVPSIKAAPSDATCGNGPAKPAASAAAPSTAPLPAPVGPFPTKVAFGAGEKKLSADGEKALGAVVDYLKAHPEAKITITGFADKAGDESKNKDNAKDRAKGVRDFLTKGGVDKKNIEINPAEVIAASGDGADARRVEIGLIASSVAPAASASAAPAGSAPSAPASAAPAGSAPAPHGGH